MKLVTKYIDTVIPTVTSTNILPEKYYYNGIIGTLTIPTLKKRYKCEYCDTITEKPGNCKNCGAPVVEVKK